MEFAIAQVASHSPNALAWRILIPAGQETEGVWALAKDGDSPRRYIPWVFTITTMIMIINVIMTMTRLDGFSIGR